MKECELSDFDLEAITGGKSGGGGGGSSLSSLERMQRIQRNSIVNQSLLFNSLGINPGSSSFDRLRARGVNLSGLGMN